MAANLSGAVNEETEAERKVRINREARPVCFDLLKTELHTITIQQQELAERICCGRDFTHSERAELRARLNEMAAKLAEMTAMSRQLERESLEDLNYPAAAGAQRDAKK